MTETPATPPIERVVVPLDAATESHAAIDTAARLAARTKAPLHGVFIEDEDLLHLAGLPFARQITLGAGLEDLTRSQVELHHKAAAARARRDFEAAARRHGITCTFEVLRGASEHALAGVSESDFIVAGGMTRPIGRHFRLECRWWSSLEIMPGPLLVVRHAWSASGAAVVVLRDRGRASARLLETAAEIARSEDRLLTVICPPGVAGRQGFETWIGERLAGSPVRLRVEVAPAEPGALRARLAELGCRLLAIDGGAAEDGGGRLRDYVERFACDILTVRNRAAD